MKKLLFFLLLSSFAFGQNLIKDDFGKYKTDTIVVSNQTKDQLFSNALKWISSNFKDSRNVIETKDSSLGEVIFKGNLPDRVLIELSDKKKTQTLANTRLYFTGKIIVKDEKFRVIFTDLKYSYITPDLYSTLYPIDISKKDPYNNQNLQNLNLMIKDISESLNKKSDNDF